MTELETELLKSVERLTAQFKEQGKAFNSYLQQVETRLRALESEQATLLAQYNKVIALLSSTSSVVSSKSRP